ncbi:efflux RND transporter periplasmic adaptor subunit [Sphingomonas nostoxanthinifaciens]|uniref:efflux RND transporter periplasmic adaptor subunit n=1 Tax=Sphingomonas nostoxanthinifaciens TaxID=2872652 RepID=UPI001CC20CFC|nr:efflux RND transporter periplasmic adaptor subunit [Sphingomonas nostoxanthinifaciens]UAK24884.1 efflux RND transporter periplasmic adaptor subunit [Sphingomonas nostoxanthinifaciens]
MKRVFSSGLMLALLASCGRQAPPPPPPPQVAVARPLLRQVTDWDDYVGRFEAVQDVTVTPRVSGTITQILFRNGQDVRAGQVLFVVDPRPYVAAYQQAVAATGRAQATLANAQTELDRAQKLRGLQAVSQEELETKQANLRTAAADVRADQAAQNAAKLNVEFTTVRAPVSGRVSDRRISLGDVVSANTTQLTRVVTLDPIWFTFEGAESLYLKYVRAAEKGQRGSSRSTANPVDIQLADESGYHHRGKMVFVDNAIDPRSGTIRAHAELANGDHMLTPGMFGRARLLGSGAYQAMLLPDEAISTDQTRKLVYVVGPDNKVAPHEVTIGPIVEGLRVIRTGIAAGDQVVLDGLTVLQPGAPVTPKLGQIKPRAPDDTPGETLSAPPAATATAK